MSAIGDTTGLRNRLADAMAQPCECNHRKGTHNQVKLTLIGGDSVNAQVPDCASADCPCQLFRPRGY